MVTEVMITVVWGFERCNLPRVTPHSAEIPPDSAEAGNYSVLEALRINDDIWPTTMLIPFSFYIINIAESTR